MNIQPILLDVVKHLAIAKVDTILVVPADDGKLRVSAVDPDQFLFVIGETLEPTAGIPDKFGLYNFKVLKGLLAMPSFSGDKAQIVLGMRDHADGTGQYPDWIEFKGGGTKAIFRTQAYSLLPEEPAVAEIPWDISILNTGTKLAEFQQMATLYNSEVAATFTLSTEEGNLIANFGTNSSATHAATMVLQEDCGVDLVGEFEFSIPQFLVMLKAASTAKAFDLKMLSRGLLGAIAVTDKAVYTYHLKKNMNS